MVVLAEPHEARLQLAPCPAPHDVQLAGQQLADHLASRSVGMVAQLTLDLVRTEHPPRRSCRPRAADRFVRRRCGHVDERARDVGARQARSRDDHRREGGGHVDGELWTSAPAHRRGHVDRSATLGGEPQVLGCGAVAERAARRRGQQRRRPKSQGRDRRSGQDEDPAVDRAQTAVGQTTVDPVTRDPRGHQLRARHCSVLLSGDPRDPRVVVEVPGSLADRDGPERLGRVRVGFRGCRSEGGGAGKGEVVGGHRA